MDWNPHYLYGKFFDHDPAAVDRFLAEIGFFAWNAQQDRGYPFSQAVDELAGQFPQYAQLIRAYDERWEESISGPIQPSVDILHSLKLSGCTLYGLSNWPAETFRRVRRRYAFFDWFKTIVISGEVKLVKPDPRIFLTFLDLVGRRAEGCLLIDDSAANIAAASQLGFHTIRFESPEQLKHELIQRGLLSGDGAWGRRLIEKIDEPAPDASALSKDD